jgi:LmbE family N-acetylglucosaminyl deacetylase
MDNKTKKVAIIVAHPDDETLWVGGTILSHPEWRCFIVCLCRKNDPDRAPKFRQALKMLGAQGIMGDLDDGPHQEPLNENEVEEAILQLYPPGDFDLVITHSIKGEYTRHLRHEEIAKAVVTLWEEGQLNAPELWAFAYEDGNKGYYPVIIEDAPLYNSLPHGVWEKKYKIITETYGFDKSSWEAMTTPKEEAFWQFFTVEQARMFLANGEQVL